jgi:hypothetical protein
MDWVPRDEMRRGAAQASGFRYTGTEVVSASLQNKSDRRIVSKVGVIVGSLLENPAEKTRLLAPTDDRRGTGKIPAARPGSCVPKPHVD